MTPLPYRTRVPAPTLIDAAIAKYGARHVAAVALSSAIANLFLPRLRQTSVDDLSDRVKQDIGYETDDPPKHPAEYLR